MKPVIFKIIFSENGFFLMKNFVKKIVLISCLLLDSFVVKATSQSDRNGWIAPVVGATLTVAAVGALSSYAYTQSLLKKSVVDQSFTKLDNDFALLEEFKDSANKIYSAANAKDLSTGNIKHDPIQVTDVDQYVRVLKLCHKSLNSTRNQTNFDVRCFHSRAVQHKIYPYEDILRNHTDFNGADRFKKDVTPIERDLESWKKSRELKNLILSILSCIPFHRYIDSSIRAIDKNF